MKWVSLCRPPDETGAPTQQANSSTAHTPFLATSSTAATAGSSTSTIDDTSNGPSIFNTQSSTVSQFSTTSSQAALMGAPRYHSYITYALVYYKT